MIRFLVAFLLLTAFAAEAQACGRLAACLKRLFASEAEQDVVTIVVAPGPQRVQSVRSVELQVNPPAPRWGTERMEQLFEAAYPQLAARTDPQKRQALANWLQKLGHPTGVDPLVYEYALPLANGRSYGIRAGYARQSGRLEIAIDAPPLSSTGYRDLGRLSALGFDDTHEGLLLRAYRAFSSFHVSAVQLTIEDTDWPDYEAYERGVGRGLGRLAAVDDTPSGRLIGSLYDFTATAYAADSYVAIFGPHLAIQSNLEIDLPAQPRVQEGKDLDPFGVDKMLQERRSLYEYHDENEVAHDDDEKQDRLDEPSTRL